MGQGLWLSFAVFLFYTSSIENLELEQVEIDHLALSCSDGLDIPTQADKLLNSSV